MGCDEPAWCWSVKRPGPLASFCRLKSRIRDVATASTGSASLRRQRLVPVRRPCLVYRPEYLVPQVRAGFAAPRCALRGASNPARWGTLHSVLLLHGSKPGAALSDGSGFLLLVLTDAEPSPEAPAALHRAPAVPVVAAAAWLEHAAMAPPLAVDIVSTRETLGTAIANARRIDGHARDHSLERRRPLAVRGASRRKRRPEPGQLAT
jgi:hypothetical protein